MSFHKNFINETAYIILIYLDYPNTVCQQLKDKYHHLVIQLLVSGHHSQYGKRYVKEQKTQLQYRKVKIKTPLTFKIKFMINKVLINFYGKFRRK